MEKLDKKGGICQVTYERWKDVIFVSVIFLQNTPL